MKPVIPVRTTGKELPVVIFAKDQPQYTSLPCYYSKNGRVTTRWKLTWKERLRICLTGNLWLQVSTFKEPLQPVKLLTKCPELD